MSEDATKPGKGWIEAPAVVSHKDRRCQETATRARLRAVASMLVMSALTLMSVPGVAAKCDTPALIDDGWQVLAAEAAGIDAQALCTALATIDTGEGNIHAVVVERGGRLVAETYRKGPDRPITVLYGLWNPFAADTDFGPATLHDVRSVSKSVVGLLVGQALQQGTLGGLDTPVLDFYPELTGLRSPERNEITLRHLLSMSARQLR